VEQGHEAETPAQLFHVEQGERINCAGTCSTWNALERNPQRADVPRETSCILGTILLTFRELGGLWRGLLLLQIKREGLERPPPL
jgi:hypothetical protein